MDEKKFSKDLQMHNVIMENREKISISGVENVESFDEERITIETTEGVLTLEGEKLHINSLSVEDGDMSIEGYIYSLVYSDSAVNSSGGGLLAKLFR